MDDSHGSTQEPAVAPVLSSLRFTYLLIRRAPALTTDLARSTLEAHRGRIVALPLSGGRVSKLEIRNPIQTRNANDPNTQNEPNSDLRHGRQRPLDRRARQTNPISCGLGIRADGGAVCQTNPIGRGGESAGTARPTGWSGKSRGREMSNKANLVPGRRRHEAAEAAEMNVNTIGTGS